MKKLENYRLAIEKVAQYAPLLIEESQKDLKAKSEEFLADVKELQYVKVPLVGIFSAGKSSLLNIFTQKPGMLPVDIMPETAVAYELYYSTTECVDLYRNGNKIDSKPLADIKQLQTEPGDIAKVYCDSESVKQLQDKGIILVDMPGIGSGIERHDAAIFNYLGTGAAFILLVDVEQGSLRGSTLTFINELSKYNVYPAVLVSKTDKKPEGDVKDIVEYVKYQLTNVGNNNPYVSTVCAVNNNLKGLTDYLATLNPETLAADKLNKKLNLIVKDVIEQLKIRVNLRNKDIANVDEKLKQIEDEIANVKENLPVQVSNADSPGKSTQDIIDNVRTALEAKADDIAQMIVDREDVENIKSAVISIVRSEIIASLKEESEQYSEALGSAVQDAVQDLAVIEIDDDIFGDFMDIFEFIAPFLDKLVNLPGVWGKIAGIILQILPGAIKWLFGKTEEEIKEDIREKILLQIIEPVTSGLQPTLLKITIENQQRIQDKIQAELIFKMESVKEGLREKIADNNKTKEDIAAEIDKLNSAIVNLAEIIV